MARVRYRFSSRRTGTLDRHNQHRIEFPELAKKVISISDIILEILDARFIKETRNPEIERIILNEGKKIIYVLNKADLVDINKVKSCLDSEIMPYVFVSCKDRRGGRELREKIKIEVSRLKIKRRANIGVLGYPNTGKSSVINLLTGRGSAKTAPEAGFTRGIQKVRLSSEILLLDTPGIIPKKENSNLFKKNLTKHTKINVRDYNKVREPEMVVHELMKIYPGVFERFYSIEADGDSEELIEKLGRKRKILKKGNEVNTDKTARLILKDWQHGEFRSLVSGDF